MKTLTRDQAIAQVGFAAVEQVENMPCDFSNRVANDGTVEFIATAKAGVDEDGFNITINAYYYQDAETVSATEDLGDLNWEVAHYTIQ